MDNWAKWPATRHGNKYTPWVVYNLNIFHIWSLLCLEDKTTHINNLEQRIFLNKKNPDAYMGK